MWNWDWDWIAGVVVVFLVVYWFCDCSGFNLRRQARQGDPENHIFRDVDSKCNKCDLNCELRIACHSDWYSILDLRFGFGL